MRILGRVALALVMLAGVVRAQDASRPPVVAVAMGDSIRLYVLAPPPGMRGFVVSGGLAGESAVRLTPGPVTAVRDAREAAIMLDSDLDAVMRALDVSDELSMMRKLETEEFAANLLSVRYPSVARVRGRFWTAGGMRRGAEYAYRVEFVDALGKPVGAPVLLRLRQADVAAAPVTTAKLAQGDRSAKLTWTYPRQRDNPQDLVWGFNIYRSEGAGAPSLLNPFPLLRDEGKPSEYEDRSLSPGHEYRYSVRAVDIAGRESAPSAVMVARSLDKVAPAPAGDIVARDGDGRSTLVWPQSPELDLAGYHVERSRGLDKPWVRLTAKLIPPDRPTFTDSTLSGGVQYFFRVVAVDSSGNEARASNAVSTLPVDRTPPLAPTAVTARAGAGHAALLSWTASRSPDVIGYYVMRGETLEHLTRVNSKPVAGVSMRDAGADSAGLPEGRRYQYRVFAVDEAFNESPAAAAYVDIPDDVPPRAPTGMSARGVLGRRVEIGWSASPSADVVRYVVERMDSTGTRTTIATRSAARMEIVRDTLVHRGARYTYSVIAVDSAGNRSTPASDTLLFASATPPPSPRNALARKTAEGVEIQWERVISSELAGYVVYKSDMATGTFTRVTAKPTSALSFVDRGARGTDYYVVRAVDTSRNESGASPAVRAP